MPASELVALSEPLPEGWLAPLTARHEVVEPIPQAADERCPRVVALLTTLNYRVDDAVLARFPNLRVVANMAVGYDNIDLAACKARGVAVGNTPGVLTEATADLAFALLLAAARNMQAAWRDAAEGRWGTWSPTGWLGADLVGATLGIVGMGQIGHAMARRARAFGLRLVYTSRSPNLDAEGKLGARRLSLHELLPASDFVSLHLPLTELTHRMLDAETLRLMKPTAYLINTARGGIVDQGALVRALDEGWIAGAALDVTEPEPLPADHPLFDRDNCLILPHIGSATRGTRKRMAQLACDNALAGIDGRPLPHPVESK